MDHPGNLLLMAVLLPLLGAVLLGKKRESARLLALVTSLLVLGLAAVLVGCYSGGADAASGGEFAAKNFRWLTWTGGPLDSTPADGGLSQFSRSENGTVPIPSARRDGIQLSLALDGLSLWLFGLTALLTVVGVLVSWEAISEQAALYYRLLLILETGMLGVFAARDIILFYIFFEFTLIPLYFLIGIWGSEERRYAAGKFFLFTLAGSVLTFLGLLTIVLWDYCHPLGMPQDWGMTFSIPQLTDALAVRPMTPALQKMLFLALFAGFAIKVPLFPLHTWLPLAHVQAPTAGSVILAGVLLKVGTYGFVRLSLPMLPQAAAAFMPWLLWLSLCGILYGALVALAQDDIKRLIAYSSVSHLGYCMLGIFAANRLGLQGGVLQMVNHGLSTGGLFAVVGMLYERYHTRQIADLGGLARQMPLLAFFTLILALSSIGLPGLNGFAGELLILVGMFQRAWVGAPAAYSVQYRIIAVAALSGMVLGAWYMLYLVQRIFFGSLRVPLLACPAVPPARLGKPGTTPGVVVAPGDLCFREIAALTPLVVLIFWIGLQPQFFLDRISPTLDHLTARAVQAADAEGSGFGVQGSAMTGTYGNISDGDHTPNPLVAKETDACPQKRFGD